MDSKQFAETYLLSQRDNFPAEQLATLQSKLLSLPEERQLTVQTLAFKSPVVALILSLFLGSLAIDRFYLGDIVLGILKILTLLVGVGIIWVLLDIYFCYKKAKEINFRRVMAVN